MSKINNLIKELCPNGVRYYKLSEIGNQFSGLSGKSKKDFENGNCKYITYTNIYNNPSTNLDVEDYVQVKENEKQNEIKYKDILVAGSSENLEDSGMISVVTKEPNEKIYLNSFCFGFRLNDNFYDKYNPDFLKHLFRDKNFRNEIISCSFGVTRYNLSKEKFLKIKIPCPPLEVQEEIVKILDKFGELEAKLEAELEAELEARKSQYEFWRGRLLNKEYEIKFLPELATNLDNKRKPVTKSDRESGNYPYYGASGIVDYVSNYIFDDDLLLVSEDGANLKARSTPIAFSSVGKVWINNHAHVLKFDNMITQKYVEHYLNMIDLNEYITGAAQPKLNQENLNKIRINIPSSIEEQEKVVIALERFDKLINDINIGLPAEIELRRKQYEYYRNKLLSFEEAL